MDYGKMVRRRQLLKRRALSSQRLRGHYQRIRGLRSCAGVLPVTARLCTFGVLSKGWSSHFWLVDPEPDGASGPWVVVDPEPETSPIRHRFRACSIFRKTSSSVVCSLRPGLPAVLGSSGSSLVPFCPGLLIAKEKSTVFLRLCPWNACA